ncbi:DUF3159 domain-containing protein [Pseudonocardia eucalypti]|uniref:DUF3159 domain-containing protein n=1 Tax=Pseudonocardia eucalypti TaxID=648755 RepID=A0ABP9R7S8_9PSEU|nr:hypothetical protein [Pseudonocardia eucalypti]
MTGRHARPKSPHEPHAPESGADGDEQREKAAPQTILEQLGGVSGMIYSTIPVVVFVLVNSLTSLMPAVIAAVGVGLLIAVVRLVRKEPLQPAVSGLLGVGVGAFIAYRTGQAKDFFLLGIWYSALLSSVFLISVLVRWPLAGVIWHGINGDGQGWRQDRYLLRGYTLASLLWVLVFGAKFVVQHWLYDTDQTGWLAFARIAMGYPLTGLALLGTIWAVQRARRRGTQVSPA